MVTGSGVDKASYIQRNYSQLFEFDIGCARDYSPVSVRGYQQWPGGLIDSVIAEYY